MVSLWEILNNVSKEKRKRAVQTAEYISATTNAPIIYEELLSEIDLGYVTGLPKKKRIAYILSLTVGLNTIQSGEI
ncbi:histidine phosphatase family protein [Paenibacillus sp. FSL R7-0204]|uniref:histidine phosphatase family protein n=1 Tax=Paenibacillus sp. FSL R7-0204 TaxID=2921675 RepID=UPI004046EC2E